MRIKFKRGVAANFLAVAFVVAVLARSAPAQESPGATNDYWTVEDSKARESLPLYQVIPAAKPDELTRANGFPKGKTWTRSGGRRGIWDGSKTIR